MISAASVITWGELLRSDAMRNTRIPVASALEREVRSVQLISDLEEIHSSRPGTVVVLQLPVARAPWAVEIAVRYAWERGVRCVIAQLDETAAQPVTRLAERLEMPVGFHDGDLPALALQLSALVTHPEALRARLVARCATRLAEQRTVAAGLNVLNQELPGVQVGLHGPQGVLIAGHQTGGADEARVIRVPLAVLDFQSGRELVAVLTWSSATWRETVTRVLEIARTHVIAYEAATRVSLATQNQRERWALDRLLARPTSREPASELGWVTSGRLIGAVLLPVDPGLAGSEQLGLSLRSSWTSRKSDLVPVPYGEGWALWETWDLPDDLQEQEDDDLLRQQRATVTQQLVKRLMRQLGHLHLGVAFCTGVGEPVDGEESLGTTLGQAMLAARAVRTSGRVGVIPFSSLGARVLLTAGSGPNLRRIARDTLAELIEREEGDQLVATLAAYLDCGGSTSRAADRLGVHRNTVTARMERIRRTNLPVDDPDRLLGLHVACYLAELGSVSDVDQAL
ncbi:helix-turn-helix domain-containing protein [Kitasatospora sp. NBC_00240]|uniref:PucR family transcriptional regulator n=1 Tax=Kitasatospora sp. NBC_00240 TaxID=2903567 RepID=UPI00224EC92A|nr:helix-turn-helix domain-containing protein [Kitasatospora sp. NBC_00240]MCX5215487.1 helix-turn-helix domain-containing protein [Kitasatospora sp. NBC_00240]